MHVQNEGSQRQSPIANCTARVYPVHKDNRHSHSSLHACLSNLNCKLTHHPKSVSIASQGAGAKANRMARLQTYALRRDDQLMPLSSVAEYQFKA